MVLYPIYAVKDWIIGYKDNRLSKVAKSPTRGRASGVVVCKSVGHIQNHTAFDLSLNHVIENGIDVGKLVGGNV